MKPYWSSRGELSVVQNILLKVCRIVIPSSMRLEILDKVHEGHQGITKCRERAKNCLVAWTQPRNPGSGATMQSLCTSKGQQAWTAYYNTLTWLSLANRSHRPLWVERHWLPYCYRLLLKIRGSGSYAEDYKVKWGHQSTHVDMGSRKKCDLTVVLSLTVQNSLTLLRNGDSSIAQVVLDFPKQIQKLSGDLELLRIFWQRKKILPKHY